LSLCYKLELMRKTFIPRQKDIERKIAKIVSLLEKETGKELNFMILSEKEFKYRYSMFDKFIHSFFEKNPVILINKMRGINL